MKADNEQSKVGNNHVRTGEPTKNGKPSKEKKSKIKSERVGSPKHPRVLPPDRNALINGLDRHGNDIPLAYGDCPFPCPILVDVAPRT